MKINNTNILYACLLTCGMAANAYAIPEQEVNDSLQTAQPLTDANTHSVEGMMGNAGDRATKDVDYFTFQAQAGDVLEIDIDNGTFDSILAIFDDTGTLQRMNAYSTDIDEGSVSIMDARIDAFVAPKSGLYTVGVSSVPRYFLDGGTVLNDGLLTRAGIYTLAISGITTPSSVKQINIEVKPGSNDLPPLNPRSRGKIPVAIMGVAGFDVSSIKQETLRFGASGNEESLSRCQPESLDLNSDGQTDLLCHFENSVAAFQSGDIEGVLKGETDEGIHFEGRALLKVLPSRRK
ncbi:MAG: PPC domain-containing protein [Gammaproteobacteria bacterium]|nr:PPC domain-containing protein [Gammaproteobacteria bacterium]